MKHINYMMNHANKLVCIFCQEVCVRLHQHRKRRWWWECNKCHTHFMASLKGAIEITQSKYGTKDKYYTLSLDYKAKTSTIEQWEQEFLIIGGNRMFRTNHIKNTKLMEFPKILPEVTPENAKDKMKLYILFS